MKSLELINSPQRAFLAIALVFGIIFAILIPPFMAPDEWMHFRRAYHISEGHLMAEKVSISGREMSGGMLPDRLTSIVTLAIYGFPYLSENESVLLQILGQLPPSSEDPFSTGRKFSWRNIRSLFKQTVPPASQDQSSFVPFPNTAVSSPHLYAPQTIGIELGKIIKLPMISLMYLGRILNLLLWLGLVYLAIKTTPIFKWLFLLLALTPTALFQSSSLSADAFTNGLSMLLTACFLQLGFGEDKNKVMLAAIFPLSLLVSISKAYFLLPFLFLIVPENKISMKQYWQLFLSLVLLTACTVLCWNYLAKGVYVPMRGDIFPFKQMLFILNYPFVYLAIIGHTLLSSGNEYLLDFVGRLGHYSLRLPTWLIYLHLTVLISIALVENDDNVVMTSRARELSAVIFFASVVLLSTLMYLSWTPVGRTAIAGIQGRYFIPIAPLFFLLFYNRKITIGRHAKKTHLAIVCYSVFLLSITTFVILNGYYYL